MKKKVMGILQTVVCIFRVLVLPVLLFMVLIFLLPEAEREKAFFLIWSVSLGLAIIWNLRKKG